MLGYNRFTAVISSELSKFEINLTDTIKTLITDEQQQPLDQLVDPKSDNYQLARLKNIDHDRSPARIHESVKDFQLVQEIYQITLPIITELKLYPGTVKHYATWVRKASSFQLSQLNAHKKYLHLVCFIQHHYYFRQDILADILLLSIKATQNAVEKEQKTIAHQRTELHNETINILTSSRVSYKELVQTIEAIIKSVLPDTEKIIKINQLLLDYHAQHPLNDKVEIEIEQNLAELKSSDYYTILEDASIKLQNRVADIMRHLQFEKNESFVFKAIEYYQLKNGNITKTAPTHFLNEQERNALKTDTGKFRVSLYKAFLYLYAGDALRSWCY